MLVAFLGSLCSLARTRRDLALKNLALRQQDDARTYQGREGFGLGLAIAAWVAEVLGGKISASNRPEGGSLFSVILPLAPSPESR